MPRVYVPATYRAAVMDLKRGTPADYARMDAIQARHNAIARRLFDAIMTGEASEAHQIKKGGYLMTIYHRSTRPGVNIQASTFYKSHLDGQWTASSHHDIMTPADITLEPGIYLTITA